MQDALGTYAGLDGTDLPLAEQGYGTLFRSGCVVDGIVNCTAACQDVNQIFADPYTLQNCMVMASIGILIAIEANVTLDGSATAFAEDFVIQIDQPNYGSLASSVNQTIQDCLYQYLDKYPGYDTDQMWAQYGSMVLNLTQFPSVCDNVLAPLNADVGGIGVRKAILFTEAMLTHGRSTSLTGFKAASPSQLS